MFMKHSEYMQLAIAEAKKGIGLTSPNPVVGAIIVKDGNIIGRGFHPKAGKPHAEREAIADALKTHGPADLKGSTIYVTLEPCSTQGRTPACVDGIIEHGIACVVYGSTDPDPANRKKADIILENHGIEVISGVEADACHQLIKPFIKRTTSGLPWVIAKTAITLDGRITRPKGEGQWITGEQARSEVHRIRATVDAIIIGGKTARKDDPRLTIRGDAQNPAKEQPWRVILTHQGRQHLPTDLHLFSDEHKDRTIIHEDLSLTESLQKLAELGCNSVLLECGGGLMRQFLEQELIDEIALFIAPILGGGTQFGFGVGDHLSRSQTLVNQSYQQFGTDIMIRGELKTVE